MLISEQVAGGIISYELKQSLKKEIDDEAKQAKGILNDTYNQFLTPILGEISTMLTKTLHAEK